MENVIALAEKNLDAYKAKFGEDKEYNEYIEALNYWKTCVCSNEDFKGRMIFRLALDVKKHINNN